MRIRGNGMAWLDDFNACLMTDKHDDDDEYSL